MYIKKLIGLPHERQFTIVCTLLKRREVGTGKSKKLAKRQAAYKMWQALQDNPPEAFQNEEEVTVFFYFRKLMLRQSVSCSQFSGHSR